VEVKPGNKQTDVGVIPEDWVVKPLAEIADKIMVGIASAATHAYRVKGVPMFRNQNVKAGHLDDSDLLFIAPEYEVTFKNKRLRSGDLLTMRTGYPGVTAIVPPQYDSAQSFTTLITRPNQREAESAFLCHYANSELGQRFFTQSQIGGAQKNVNVATLRNMPIPLPPPPEQRAIAGVLSDVDALIGGLDQLIAKKRDLKQAAMQQLLTGQTRLPGFHGEWEVKRLGDVLKVRHGKSQHGITAPDGKYPILASGGEIGRTNAYIYDQPSVLIGRKGTIDSPQYVDSPFWTVDTLFFTEVSSAAHAKFVFYKFTMIRWRTYNEASGVPSLNSKTIENIEVTMPSLSEQAAIAEVLTEMDAELAVLTQRREKTRALKQAMMQELLTGRTRLV
jgi:type I restriction enzyme S subunit